MPTTSYKITIVKISTWEYQANQEMLAEERHYTDTELDKEHNWMRQQDRTDLMKKIYKQTIATKTTSENKEIYEQVVEELDLPKVILAINKLDII